MENMKALLGLLAQMSDEEKAALRSVLTEAVAPAAAPVGTAKKVDLDSLPVVEKRLPGAPRPHVFYTLLRTEMRQGGNIPAQQQIIANLLVGGLPIGEKVPEAEVMNLVSQLDGTPHFPVVPGKQNAWQVFKYYLNLQGVRGKYYGFRQRGLLEVEGVTFR